MVGRPETWNFNKELENLHLKAGFQNVQKNINKKLSELKATLRKQQKDQRKLYQEAHESSVARAYKHFTERRA